MNEQSTIHNPQSTISFIFPGQGSQSVGMGKDLYDNFAVARAVFEEADKALGFKLSELCFAGNSEDLQLTENTQPAILTVSIAAFRVVQSADFPMPSFVAGHSLGEYSALVAANAISFADAVRIVRLRGRFMQEAVPLGVGAMAAVLGADLRTVNEACLEAAQNQICSAANINSGTQIVIAGHSEAVDRAVEILKSRGAKRAIKLNVSAPFHCSLMQPAQEKLAAELENIEFSDLHFPCVSNVAAEPNISGEKARALLIKQVTAPVQWANTVEFFLANETKTFVEIGPGKVLNGLVRQIDRSVNCFNVEDSGSLQTTKIELAV
jgi:[acyl-carrier-protein] S-malonyltransferase